MKIFCIDCCICMIGRLCIECRFGVLCVVIFVIVCVLVCVMNLCVVLLLSVFE